MTGTTGAAQPIEKAATGIAGLDGIMRGGLPRGRTTLIEGGPGCGKTILALQTLVNGARQAGEPAIFVAFEESSRRIVANAESFGWDLPALQRQQLFFLDAQPSPGLVQSGGFDLGGMLAAIEAKAHRMGARRIAFDALDMVLALLDGRQAARRETYRLHEWLAERGLTSIITAKASPRRKGAVSRSLEFMQFMVDCSISLRQEMVQGTSQRSIRIGKYRGSSFEENATPLLIGPQGIEVAFTASAECEQAGAPTERVSSGVERLDTMLGCGYYRAAGVLLTGAPGTANTTLAGAFARAACDRGDRTLFITLDSPADEVIRNLESVGIDLAAHRASGLLRMIWARSTSGSAEIHMMRIREMARAHGSRCVVVDPISALSKSGNRRNARNVVERLIDWAKAEGITLVCTSLLDSRNPAQEGSPVQVSTLADTWIHLSYLVHAGERNRALSVIKSRGASHSNQVRELILDARGVTLADVYTAGGEVLMGTMRWEKEHAERLAAAEAAAEAERQRQITAAEVLELEGRLKVLQQELDARRASQARLAATARSAAAAEADSQRELHRIRRGDIPPGPDDAAHD